MGTINQNNQIERPDTLPGHTIKLKVNTSKGDEFKLYITICHLENQGFEVFINTKNAELSEHLNSLMVMISLALRSGVPLSKIAEELKEICSPFTGHMTKKGYMSSLYAAIGNVFTDYDSYLKKEQERLNTIEN